MMKYLTPASIVLVTNSQQLALMASPEYTMSLQEPVSLCFKDIKMKFQRYLSIHKAIRSSPQVAIRLADYGQ
jgi:hypothetical protein